MLVSEIMSSQVLTVAPACLVRVAKRIMDTGKVNFLPVTVGDQAVVGVISSSDLLRSSDDSTPVSALMSEDWCEAGPGEEAAVVAERMQESKAHHVLVIQRGVLIGVVSSLDLLPVAARRRSSKRIRRGTGRDERRTSLAQVLAVGCRKRVLEAACESRFELHWADRIQERASEIEVEAFDLLVVNARAPKALDEICTVRDTLTVEQLPILVITETSSEREVLRAHAAGATDTVGFAVSPDVLRAKLNLMMACFRRQDWAGGPGLPGGNERAFGRYRIQDELGSGGFGVVYSAYDCDRDTDVALKVLFPGACQQREARYRFLREFYALSTVTSPHVVEALDSGLKEGRPYLAMELVKGPSLEQLVRETGPLDARSTSEVLVGVARGMAALEQVRLLHRDLKPANVILRNGKAAGAVLVDLGLAKRPGDRSVTSDDVILGTAAYLAPERIRGEGDDLRSDLFALGMLGRFMVNGHAAYPRLRGWELFAAMARPLPPLAEDKVDGTLCTLLNKLTAFDPGERYQTLDEVFAALSCPAPGQTG